MLPLYDNLKKNLSKKELDKNCQEFLLEEIKKFNKEDMEIMYGLILSFCKDEKLPSVYYPFNAINNDTNVEFKLSNLPIKLQNLLYKFCKIKNNSKL